MHGDRAALRVGEQAEDDLQQPTLAVPAVAELGEGAGMALEVGRGQVVEDERAFAQMALGEALLDALLAFEEPVHGAVEFIFVGFAHLELVGERALGEGPCRGELRPRVEHAGHDHRAHEVALTRGGSVEKRVETEGTQGTEHGGDVAVGQAAHDLEPLLGGHEALAAQGAADQVDGLGRQMREVAHGLVQDLAALAVGAAEQVRLVGLAFVVPSRGGYVNCTISGSHGP